MCSYITCFVQISASEAFAKKSLRFFRDGFCDYFRHAYKLHTSQRQPSTRTGEFTMAAAGRASGPTRAGPGIRLLEIFMSHEQKMYFQKLRFDSSAILSLERHLVLHNGKLDSP